ncbi:MAG: hypothetical protein AB7O37_12405 [Vicinamibacteria bacterium]
MSSRSNRLAPALVCLALLTGCRGEPREPFVTYFNADFDLTLRYPSGWQTDQAQQDGVWYRYFLAPPAGPKRKPAVSVTLLVGTLAGSVDAYAQTYVGGNTLVSSREERRGWGEGKSFLFASPDGATRHSLLLLKREGRVFGLYAQGEAPLFESHQAVLDEMVASLLIEPPSAYLLRTNADYGFSLRLPASWQETRRFSGGGAYLLQFRSPALAADRDREAVHASLTLSVEPLAAGTDLDAYYDATRRKLGDAYQVLSHGPWSGGYVDVLRAETPVAVSRVKRYFRTQDQRGFSLSFEARDDVFPRVSRWCDAVASTFRTGSEVEQK